MEWLARVFGWKTLYHVSWSEPMGGTFKIGDMTVVVSPWITSKNYKDVRKVVADSNNVAPENIIISISRL